jgi:protein PsiE
MNHSAEDHGMEPMPDYVVGLRHWLHRFLLFAELLGLVVIALATAVAMFIEIKTMIVSAHVSLTDLLLMFLYLEVLAMIGQYFKAGQLPVRFPLYIAMVALARELILGGSTASEWHIVSTTGAILMLALGVLLIRFGQVRFPTSDDEKPGTQDSPARAAAALRRAAAPVREPPP